MFKELQGMEGVLNIGDGRADSPGHCAKSESYTILQERIDEVIDVQLVQVCEIA